MSGMTSKKLPDLLKLILAGGRPAYGSLLGAQHHLEVLYEEVDRAALLDQPVTRESLAKWARLVMLVKDCVGDSIHELYGLDPHRLVELRREALSYDEFVRRIEKAAHEHET